MTNKILIWYRETTPFDHKNYWSLKRSCPWNTRFADKSSWGELQNDHYQNHHTSTLFGECNKYMIIQVFENNIEIACGLLQYIENFNDLYEDGKIVQHKPVNWKLDTIRYDERIISNSMNTIDPTGLDQPKYVDGKPSFPTKQMIERRRIERWFMTLVSCILTKRFVYIDFSYPFPYVFVEPQVSSKETINMNDGIHPPNILDNYKINFQNVTGY